MVVDAARTAFGAALLALLISPSCLEREQPVDGVLLVTLDTTRADRIGCYGYAPAATPSLDALASGATRFADASSAIPTTLGSHATMFTGQYPPVHGIRYNGMFQLAERSVTVAELLRDAGFATAAVPAAYPVATESGIGQGFQVYEDLFAEPGGKQLPAETERTAADVSKRGIEWLGKVGEKRFFLWLHYYDPHYPYAPPFPYSATFRERPYDGEIAYVDRELGKVFAALKEMGKWDRTVIVVAGDHGEGLYQHDEKMHAHLVYQTALHVPLLVKGPGAERPRVVSEPVTLADVAPTILDYAGVPIPGDVQGVSLKPAVRGAAVARRGIYFESLAGSLVYGWSPLDGIRRDRYKLIRSGAPELYDLGADPEERTNVYEMEGEIAADLTGELTEDLARWKPSEDQASTTAVPVDARKMEELASLGYLAGSITPGRLAGANPREKIHLEQMIFDARERMLAQDYAGALASIGSVLAEDPENRYGLQMATTAAARLGRFDEAEAYADHTLRQYPEYVPAWVARGDLYVRRGRFREAADTFRRGLEKSPGEAALTYRLALALLSDGRTAEASEVVEKAIAAKVEQPSFLVVRALCRARTGDPAGAREALSEAIAKGYRNRDVLESEPLLSPLRRVPGFRDLLKGIPAETKA